MKVLCIDSKPVCPHEYDLQPELKEGESYDVKGEFKSMCSCCGLTDIPTYKMVSYGHYYSISHFIIGSDIDETEMVREYNLQKA